ncbi:helical backbone metal receptor [Cytophagales bacterium LB-30]|uniref:Helical backbone metal receptor n=1 Tax=Shiella aurantiaca TaxID=3058365 RepID=A0ABT8F7R7_9BACT|nr:helical backbone metal receptor [Shiella aurantiaca]MDN4166487.1 helical backbone metal receptor [Shiella aurantiaca]
MTQTKWVFDQMGRNVEVPLRPQRIVSLVPSQTELLFDLGLGDRVVGRTRFCIHPKEEVKKCESVGGTKDFTLERIAALNPDLIIGNKEENEQSRIEEVAKYFPVWMSDIVTFQDALAMISQVGALTQADKQAKNLVKEIEQGFAKLNIPKSEKHTLYLIWKNPYMAAGTDTFIHQMMQCMGLSNVLSPNSRYPELTEADISRLDPDVILLSSEPYPFQKKHEAELKMIAPGARVLRVDGEMFSWYGSRLRLAPGYFAELISHIG